MKTVLGKLVGTDGHDYALFVTRVALGLVMLPHGLQKTAGLFGGYGYSGTMGYFTGTLGLPAPAAFLVILAESAGAVALVLGLFGRFAAFGVAAVMVGAVAMAHWPNGFFMNWMGQQAGEGFEYHVLAFAMALAVMIRGSGALSVDAAFSRTRLSREATAAGASQSSPAPGHAGSPALR